ncbi:MAG TPA: citryl-CoA lyase [Caulobacteraceae bacterium]|jgi:citrate synthase
MPDYHTTIATSDATSITMRGLDLVRDVIGERSFTEATYFSMCGRMPNATEVRVLDACLVTLMEHGLTPSALVSRLVIDSVPDEIQVAMAAGLSSIGSVFVGTMEGCARILEQGIQEGGDRDAYCARVIAEHRQTRKPVPGFGHPHHKPDDPRSPRLFDVAKGAGVEGRYIDLLQRLGVALDEAAGRHMTINATGAIGALLLEIGVPVTIMRGVAVVSRSAGLMAHIREEREQHTARHLWQMAMDNIPYRPPER